MLVWCWGKQWSKCPLPFSTYSFVSGTCLFLDNPSITFIHAFIAARMSSQILLPTSILYLLPWNIRFARYIVYRTGVNYKNVLLQCSKEFWFRWVELAVDKDGCVCILVDTESELDLSNGISEEILVPISIVESCFKGDFCISNAPALLFLAR